MNGPCLRWQALRSVSAGWMPLIHIKEVLAFRDLFHRFRCVGENHGASNHCVCKGANVS